MALSNNRHSARITYLDYNYELFVSIKNIMDVDNIMRKNPDLGLLYFKVMSGLEIDDYLTIFKYLTPHLKEIGAGRSKYIMYNLIEDCGGHSPNKYTDLISKSFPPKHEILLHSNLITYNKHGTKVLFPDGQELVTFHNSVHTSRDFNYYNSWANNKINSVGDIQIYENDADVLPLSLKPDSRYECLVIKMPDLCYDHIVDTTYTGYKFLSTYKIKKPTKRHINLFESQVFRLFDLELIKSFYITGRYHSNIIGSVIKERMESYHNRLSAVINESITNRPIHNYQDDVIWYRNYINVDE